MSYRQDQAIATGILFDDWGSSLTHAECIERMAAADPYEPGNFYKRELPCLLTLLGRIDTLFHFVVVDGYVWLREEHAPGLGYHLFRALGEMVPVIGVAKSLFRGAELAQRVLRGKSTTPLYVTSAGIDPVEAAANIARMHGLYRIPTMLKRVDRLCRSTGAW